MQIVNWVVMPAKQKINIIHSPACPCLACPYSLIPTSLHAKTHSPVAALDTGGMDWAGPEAGCWADQVLRSNWTRWLTASKSCSRESVERSPAPAVGIEVVEVGVA